MGLTGKRVVIIGGSSGIGLAVAAAAIRESAEVFIGSSQAAKVTESKLQLGAGAEGAPIDVTDEGSIASFFRDLGPFDHLVYTAGDWGNRDARSITDVEGDDFRRVLAVRFSGALLTVKHAASRVRSGGSISLTDGIVAHRPRKGGALFTAMAGAIEHLTAGLAIDLAPIRVNAVCPGVIDTSVWGDNAEAKFRTVTDSLPLPRMGKPGEVAEAYLYLMKGDYTTGQVLRVDGGRSLI